MTYFAQQPSTVFGTLQELRLAAMPLDVSTGMAAWSLYKCAALGDAVQGYPSTTVILYIGTFSYAAGRIFVVIRLYLTAI